MAKVDDDVERNVISELNVSNHFFFEKFPFRLVPPFMSVTVNGNGTFVEIVKGILDAMTPATSSYKFDVTPCLPSPSVPNTDRYAQICKSKIRFRRSFSFSSSLEEEVYIFVPFDKMISVFLVIMSWILLVFEPYGLR